MHATGPASSPCHGWWLALVSVVTVLTVACGGRSPVAPTPAPASSGLAIMGPSQLTAAQLVTWFANRQPQPGGIYRATAPVDLLAQYFVEEGAAEGVTGDVAFMQSVVETGWFRFSGVVAPSLNNFAGIGATDSNPSPAAFPDARTGVRAQVQHLRAYADATAYACAMPPLHNPCVDPRFDLVVPKGKPRTWDQMGNGNWATASTYAATILTLYNEARAFHGFRTS